MTEIKSSSIKAVIMDMLKTRFGGFTLWKRIEVDMAVLCADLPEATTESKKKELIKGLEKIRDFLLEKEVELADLKFLDEEIDRYEHTKQISLYEEQEDSVERSVIKKYARISYGTEGVMGIHLAYNYEQLKRLTNGVYTETGLIKFYISREKTIYGKIIAEIYEYPQKIPIAALIESRKVVKETGDPVSKRVALFGEKFNLREFNKIKEIELPFYVYRFVTEHNQDLILLTNEQYEIGDYIVTGVVTQCDDYKALTDSAKLQTKLPFFFAQSVKNRIIKFKDHAEFRARLSHLGISKKSLFNFPFTVKKKDKQYILKNPTWFKWLLWSWLTHAPVGLFNKYPLHILWIGDKHSGKSLALNTLHSKSKESRSVFSGSSSTLKHLVPSFKYQPARLGYLAESNRFSFCDEFLRCLVNTRTTKEGSQREEGVAIMNDLLEHQKREAGSGVSRVNVNMTSRIIATSNPIKGIHCVEDLVNMLDESFACRWLIYYQTKEHVELIRKSKDDQLDISTFELSDTDWVSILDYLHTFKSEYDIDRVERIMQSVEPVLSENLKKHYDARHLHHVECLIDGIIKTRCLFDRDTGFKATDQDYGVLEEVWKHLIRSWVNPDMIKKLPVDDRIFYLPEDCQWIYWKIVGLKRPVLRYETEELALKEMTKRRYINAMVILLNNLVLKESEGVIKPHFMKDEEQ